MFGLGAALLMAIGGGLGIIGAAKSSSAAKQAAKTQQKAAEQAMAYQTQMYQLAQQLYAPYIARGQQTSNTLGRLMAAPGGSRYAAPPTPPATGLIPFDQFGVGTPKRATPPSRMTLSQFTGF